MKKDDFLIKRHKFEDILYIHLLSHVRYQLKNKANKTLLIISKCSLEKHPQTCLQEDKYKSM